MNEIPEWGVFTFGNDAVIDWLLPFLESLRRFEPDLPLRMIPFDDRVDRCRELLEAYGGSLHEPDELAEWDAIGEALYPGRPFHARGFRKLAAFAGPFRRFLYCDTDVAVLAPLGDLFRAAAARDPDLVHFDTDVEQVYRPGPLRDRMAAQGLATGFNCGIFCGRRGAMSVDEFRTLARDWREGWSSALVENAEQPFVNLQADLAALDRAGQWELLPEHCSTCWAAVGEFREESDGAWRLRGTTRWDEGWRLLFAHWAGFRREGELPNRHVLERFDRAARQRFESP